MSQLTVSEAARLIGARPRDISDLFYARHLRDDICPIIGGRRMIPAEYVEVIRAALHHHGRAAGREQKEVARA
jgi:hypothetical protein